MRSLFKVIRSIIDHPLNRHQKLQAILRFARWQLGSRLLPGTIVYNWINNTKLLVRRGETGLTGNIYAGLHEFADMAFLLHVTRDSDLFVDIGANAGSYTVLACGAAGARGISFEPVPGTFERLASNIHLNYLSERVSLVNKALGRTDGHIQFTQDQDTMNHAVAPGESHAKTITVEVTTLDTAIGDQNPTIAKIDVEGYETEVLAGGQRTLANPALRSIIMELNGRGNNYGQKESAILESIIKLGFHPYSYDPFKRQLAPLDGKNVQSGNTLFIRDLPFVESRIRTAPKIFVNGAEL